MSFHRAGELLIIYSFHISPPSCLPPPQSFPLFANCAIFKIYQNSIPGKERYLGRSIPLPPSHSKYVKHIRCTKLRAKYFREKILNSGFFYLDKFRTIFSHLSEKKKIFTNCFEKFDKYYARHTLSLHYECSEFIHKIRKISRVEGFNLNNTE